MTSTTRRNVLSLLAVAPMAVAAAAPAFAGTSAAAYMTWPQWLKATFEGLAKLHDAWDARWPRLSWQTAIDRLGLIGIDCLTIANKLCDQPPMGPVGDPQTIDRSIAILDSLNALSEHNELSDGMWDAGKQALLASPAGGI